jgi:hypothetical protein
MALRGNLFATPAPWRLGPGPKYLHSVDDALAASEIWLAVTPDVPRYREPRQAMLALRDVLSRMRDHPDEADLVSAKMAIKSTVRSARALDVVKEVRGAAGPKPTVSVLKW